MNFISSNTIFLLIFRKIGQSPYLFDNPTPGRQSLSHILQSNVLVIVQTIFSLSQALWLLYLVNFGGYQRSSSIAERVIIDLVTICEIVKICSVCSQCLFYKNHLIDVISTFQYIEKLYIRQVNYFVQHNVFKRRYSIKFAMLVLVYVTQLLIFTIKTMYLGLNLIGVPVKLLQLVKIFSVLHSIFYIDMLTFLLMELNCVIRQNSASVLVTQSVTCIMNAGKAKHYDLIRKKLKFFKTIHFDLWESSQRISTYFGWSLAAMLLHGFIEFVYSFYWLCQMVQPSFSFIKIIRK